MKRIFALLAALCLLLCMGAAMAASPTVSITPVDYQSGRTTPGKVYVENELYRLRVKIDVPRFVSMNNMALVIETAGVDVQSHNVQLMTGEYYIQGMVREQPAAITVKLRDTSYDRAQTAEELYNALQHDRTVYDTYRFYAATAPESGGSTIYIPKTGDRPLIEYLVICAAFGLALYCIYCIWRGR